MSQPQEVQFHKHRVFRHFFSTFRVWKDLMTENYENYTLLKSDDGFTECYNWFWSDINDDDLDVLMDGIDRREEKLIPLTLEELDYIESFV